jgi:peptidoglycan/xylan/chitin deacetylase (PgdA/CDA1 family)
VVVGRIVEGRNLPLVSQTDGHLQRAWESHLGRIFPAAGDRDFDSIGSEAEAEACFGLNCSIACEHLRSMGGFDPALRTDEDMEFGLRLYRAGFAFRYAPTATVLHRNRKDMSSYYPQCWRNSGVNDVHRLADPHQRSAQTANLSAMHHGPLHHQALNRMAFRAPRLFLRVAADLQKMTDARGDRYAFAAWSRLRRLGEYWAGVRETGTTAREIEALSGHAGRILAFHSLSRPRSAPEAAFHTSPDRFRLFISILRRLGLEKSNPVAWIENGSPSEGVLLTFDDAYEDLYSELLPITQEHDLKPIVFVVSGEIGGSNVWDAGVLAPRSLIHADQIREMRRYGITFGSHSMSHPDLTQLDSAALRREVRDSKAKLEDLIGSRVDWFAYPYGRANRRVRAAIQEAGYLAAVTTRPGVNVWEDPMALRRVQVGDLDSPLEFLLKVATGKSLRVALRNRLESLRDAL